MKKIILFLVIVALFAAGCGDMPAPEKKVTLTFNIYGSENLK